MAYISPYQTAGVEQNLITQLLKTKRKAEEGEYQGRIQKGEMIKEYGKDVRGKTAEIDAAARRAQSKKRKKNILEAIIPIATMIFGGPLAAGLGAGISTGYGASRDASFAEKTARNLQKYIKETPLSGTGKAGFDPWEGTFLSERAADFKAGRLSKAADLDSVIAQAKKAGGFGNVFGQALMSGLTSYALKSAMEGGDIGKMSTDILAGGSAFNIGDIVGEIGKGGPLEQLFSGDTLSNLLFGKEEGTPQNTATLQMLLQSIGALQDY